MLSLPEWRPRHLLVAWVAYWLLLLLGWLGPGIPLLFRLSHTGAHGTASVAANDGALSLVIATGGHTWTRAAGYGALTVLVIVPPLLLWLLWVALRPRRVA